MLSHYGFNVSFPWHHLDPLTCTLLAGASAFDAAEGVAVLEPAAAEELFDGVALEPDEFDGMEFELGALAGMVPGIVVFDGSVVVVFAVVVDVVATPIGSMLSGPYMLPFWVSSIDTFTLSFVPMVLLIAVKTDWLAYLCGTGT